MDVQPRTLEQMALYRTRYEVELTIGSNTRIVGYSVRKAGDVLLGYIGDFKDEIVRHIGDPDSAWITSRKDAIEINDCVTVRFTGRTERDARRELDRQVQPNEAA